MTKHANKIKPIIKNAMNPLNHLRLTINQTKLNPPPIAITRMKKP